MTYRIDPVRDLPTEVRRIAAEQAAKARRVLMNVEATGVARRSQAMQEGPQTRAPRTSVPGDQYEAMNHAFRETGDGV
jgi:hypothetical protein